MTLSFGRRGLLVRAFLFLSISWAGMARSSTVWADETAAPDVTPVTLSERRAAEAFQAYTRKEYALAVRLYLDAYDAAPSGSILYNIARIYDTKLADRPLAIVYYRRYIADPGAYTERIEMANQRLAELRKAELSASKLPEREPQPARESPEPVPGLSAGGANQPFEDDQSGWSTLRWTSVAMVAAGIVGVGVGAGFGLSAMSKASTASEQCDGNACTSQSGVDAANSANQSATISNIGFAAGGALLVAGTALFVLSGEPASQHASGTGISWVPEATRSSLSLGISGKW